MSFEFREPRKNDSYHQCFKCNCFYTFCKTLEFKFIFGMKTRVCYICNCLLKSSYGEASSLELFDKYLDEIEKTVLMKK